MLYDAKGEILTPDGDHEELSFEDIPVANFDPPTQKPDWFDSKVNEIGGFVDNATKVTPRYRVMWGMDTKNTVFAMGKQRMKYITICDTIQTTLGYNIVNASDPKKTRYVDVKMAHAMYADPKTGQLTLNVNPGELLVPVMKEEEFEIGLPLWVVEQWVPSIALGTEREWKDHRWMTNPDNPLQYIDVLGPYPEHGRYIHWFDVIDLDDDGQEIYRDLDESVIEIIRANHVANIARRKQQKYDSRTARRQRRNDWVDKEWAKFDGDITRGMEDVKKNRKFDITGKG